MVTRITLTGKIGNRENVWSLFFPPLSPSVPSSPFPFPLLLLSLTMHASHVRPPFLNPIFAPRIDFAGVFREQTKSRQDEQEQRNMVAATSAVGDGTLNASNDSSFLTSVFRALRNKDGPPSPRPQRKVSGGSVSSPLPGNVAGPSAAGFGPTLSMTEATLVAGSGASGGSSVRHAHARTLLAHISSSLSATGQAALDRLCNNYHECLVHQTETVLDWLCSDFAMNDVGCGVVII